MVKQQTTVETGTVVDRNVFTSRQIYNIMVIEMTRYLKKKERKTL